MIKDYILFSIGNLRKRGLRSWLTMLGIFIGIAAVVSLIGLGEGLRVAIGAQFGFLGSDVLSIQASGLDIAGPPGSGAVTPLDIDLYKKVEKVSGVEAAFNRYVMTGTIEFNNRQSVGMATSVPGGVNRKIVETMMNMKAEQGRLLKEGDGKKVFLGINFGKDDAIFGKAVKAGDRVIIEGETFDVVGIMESKGSFLFDNIILMNEQILLDTYGDDGATDIIAVKVKDPAIVPKVKEDIEKLMRKERGVKEGEEDFSVESPQNIIETLNSTLFAVQLFVYIIAGISILVGGIGIMNTMFTSVLERTKEIGIMKAIGARNSVIFTLFFIESGFLGMVGGIIGIILGLTAAYGLAFIGGLVLGSELIQAHVSIWLIIGSLLFSFLVGTAAGVLPAVQASKMRPVDAIRHAK